ncbi:zinc metallopeptidase [Candidatus Peregrinibacteria bacterium]|nr:zinc metallopeptidase [Candidatus Peregrinibacteria bacterium]
MYPFYDATFLLIIPAIIFTLYAQYKVHSTFRKYEKIANERGMTGMDVARKILDQEGLNAIPVEKTGGLMGDHYDPIKKVLRLSEKVYSGKSISALGVAAHEVGHAIQQARSYHPLIIRTTLYPVVSVSSYLAPILIFLGFIVAGFSQLLLAGIILFSASVVFTVVTLPVEFDASRRAVAVLETHGFVRGNEIQGVKKVLNAAALTYVAAAITAVLELIRLILIFQRRN